MTTQAQQIRDLKEHIAGLEDRAKTVREYWFPFPGHDTPELCGIAVRTLDGDRWGIFEEAQFAPAAFVGDRWASPWAVSTASIYRYEREEALELAPGLAEASAKAYTLAAEVIEETTEQAKSEVAA